MQVILSAQDQKDLHYEVECILRMFLPQVRLRFCQEPEAGEAETVRITTGGGEGLKNTVSLTLGDFSGTEGEPASGSRKDTEASVCRCLYRLLARAAGKGISWGVLTGIRPVKLVRELREQGLSGEKITSRFTDRYLAAPEKAALCLRTDTVQQPAIARSLAKGYSLYISIPFCPSRCSYCSFVSHSIEKTKKLIPEYLEKLEEELRYTAAIAQEKGLLLQTIYMGGGTPTVLEPEQLRRLLETVNRCFDRSHCTEFTVEAGRPDTITEEKLEALIQGGVNRISVNPQTLNDRVLEAVGRRHTAEDFFRAYQLARTFPFTAVNIDLIAGLTGDTLDSFQHTLEQVIALAPENITVHALTMKRAADMIGEKVQRLGETSQVGAMVDHSQAALAQAGYQPYYLYRQKSTVDSLENVGFCKGDTPCLYNIYIMDETHTILSAGGGGVTKVVLPGNRIERLFNYKYPYEYISRFPTILERKDALKNFPL